MWLVLAAALFKEWFGTNTRVRASNLFHLLSPLSSYTTFCDDTTVTPPDGTIATSHCDHSVDRGSPIFKNRMPKSGVYKIQNLLIEGYLDTHLHSMEPCQRSRGRKGTCTSVYAIPNLLV